jgi:hypothetical protein
MAMKAPGIPHALCSQRASDFWQKPGRTAPRGANARLRLAIETGAVEIEYAK